MKKQVFSICLLFLFIATLFSQPQMQSKLNKDIEQTSKKDTITLPYSEDFENAVVGTPGTLPMQWTNETDDDFDWFVNAGGTTSSSTGPEVDHTLGTAAGKYMYIESSSPNYPNKVAHLTTPFIDMNNNPCAGALCFWYFMYGSGIGELHVDVFYNGAWILDVMTPLIGQQQSSQTDPWLQAIADLTAYTDLPIKVRFRGITGSDYTSDIAIDDISFTIFAGLPHMVVNPQQVGDTLLIGTSSFKNIEISNTDLGCCNLTYTITENPLANWVNVYPDSGIIHTNNTDTINVNFDANGLSGGDYATDLIITDSYFNFINDTIPVTLKVINPNFITCSDTLLVGNVAVGDTDSTSFWIYNNSLANFYYDLFISPHPFDNNEYIFPHLKNNSNWTLQFAHPLSGTNSGVEFDGTYFYITQAFSSLINQYDNTGNYIGQFSIPGVSGLRDLAFDGTYMYGGSAGNLIYKMDFYAQSLIGTINSPNQTVRHIAYDEINDAFWVGNWNTDMDLVDRSGIVLNTIPSTTMGLQLQGSAYDNYSVGGPFLWVFDQGSGPGTPHYIRQIDLASGTLTGVQYDVTNDFPNSNGIGGGLFVTNDYIQNTITLGGILRDTSDILFGYEIGLDLPWIEIDPTTGIIPPADSAEIKVYWFGQNSPSVIEGYISTSSNDPLNPIISLVHLILNTIVSSINKDAQHIPNKYSLHQNYPNPFNPTTTIRYDLKENTFVNLSIYNILGEKIRTLVNKKESAGFKSVVWDGLNDYGEQVSTGIYIFRLEAGYSSTGSGHRFFKSRKMVFIK